MAEERKLTSEEKEELVAAREAYSLPDLEALDEVMEAASMGLKDEVVFHLGVWFGDRVAQITGWVWVWVSFGEGLEAPALVSADRGVCLLPLQFVASAIEVERDPWKPEPNPLRAMIERLESGVRPKGEAGSYALVSL